MLARPDRRSRFLLNLTAALAVALQPVPVGARAEALPNQAVSNGVTDGDVGAAPKPATFLHRDPFDIKERVGFDGPYRYRRHRGKASLWGDGFGNFGAEHVKRGHVGFGKDWFTENAMLDDIARALRKGEWIEDPNNRERWIVTYTSKAPWLDRIYKCGCGYTTVIMSNQIAPDAKFLGVVTAWRNRAA
jgi:hypothetical protein